MSKTNKPELPECLLILADVSNELRCSIKTVRRRIKAGALPVIRDGRLVRVLRSDLVKFIKKRRRG